MNTARTQFPGLDADEVLRATAPASFRGALAATVRSTLSLRSDRRRNAAFQAWAEAARAAGFEPEDPDLILGVTDDRLLAWRPSFFVARPTTLSASMPIARVYAVSTMRHGLLTGVSFVTDAGVFVEFEALRGRRLRNLAQVASAVAAERRGRR